MLKAKPVEYRHRKFLSTLEARWAAFFDLLHIPFRYELETYELAEGSIFYKPDFYLPESDMFVEIKGDEPSRLALIKASALCMEDRQNTCILIGDPFDCAGHFFVYMPYWLHLLHTGIQHLLYRLESSDVLHKDNHGYVWHMCRNRVSWTSPLRGSGTGRYELDVPDALEYTDYQFRHVNDLLSLNIWYDPDADPAEFIEDLRNSVHEYRSQKNTPPNIPADLRSAQRTARMMRFR